MSGQAAPLEPAREPDARRQAAADALALLAPPPSPPPAASASSAWTTTSGAAQALPALPPRLKSPGCLAARRASAVLPTGAWQSPAAAHAMMQETRLQKDLHEGVAASTEAAEEAQQPPTADETRRLADPESPEPEGMADMEDPRVRPIAPPAPDGSRLGSHDDDSGGDRHEHPSPEHAGPQRAGPARSTTVQAVNERIERLPQVRTLAELSQCVQSHLREGLRAGRGARLVLLGHLRANAVEDSPTGNAQLLAALQAKARVRGRKRLMLQHSPHHGDPASRELLRAALRCGFIALGHDVLGQTDPGEPAYRIDDRERAMALAVVDALREADLVIASCRTPHLPTLQAALEPSTALLSIALVAPVADDDEPAARLLRAVLDHRATLCLRTAAPLEQG